MMDLNELNPAQQEAVLYNDGPSLVIAGAGSGKTRVLTYKIAHLLELGLEPWSILALTFTNKAAEEMKARIARQVGTELASRLWMGTFHSIFSRMLHYEHQYTGYSSNFTIYDAADSKSLLKTIIREMGLDDKQYKPGSVAAHISAAKNRLVGPDAYLRDAQCARADQAAHIPETGRIYARYAQRCRQADAMDFDDILMQTYTLFATHPEVLQKYQQHFRYILVDEYQDTNYAQHAIVWQLAQNHRHVCVVGDDAQSIYSFRGANIDNILTFQKLYAGARLFKLEQNYRSTQNIVGAANSLIRHNRGQIPKEVFSQKEAGQPIHVYGFYSDLEEAAGVAKKVLGLNRYDHVGWSDIAILYRTNAQSRTFEDAFRKQSIPYRVYGALSFYQRKEIKDMIAYFRLAVNPTDEEALRRVINYPARGIGQTTLQHIAEAAQAAGVAPWHVIASPETYGLHLSGSTLSRLRIFAEMIQGFHSQIDSIDAAQLGHRIADESGVVREVFRGREPEDISRQENLQQLLDGMQQFVDERREEEGNERVMMTHYLQEISLISDLDESDDDSDEKLSLMTVHAAKGLEFKVVFIVGMEENLFPNQMASASPREMEEERRLFYVALTRAKEQCFITYAMNRYRFGRQEFSTPSSFITDIDENYLDVRQSGGTSSPRRSSSMGGRSLFSQFNAPAQSSSRPSTMHKNFPSLTGEGSGVGPRVAGIGATSGQAQPVSETQTAVGTLTVGTRIEHARFGQGTVTALAGTGVDARATVSFDNVGTKQLLLRFAKFSICD